MANISELYAAAWLGELDTIYKVIHQDPRILEEVDAVLLCLVEINKDLVRVKGRERVTPLHFLCQSGDGNENITLLIDLLVVFPDSIQDVNVSNETALHIALNNGNLRTFRVLVGWLKNNVLKGAYSFERSVFNWKDSASDTILHIAILNDNIQAVDLLLMIRMVKINAKNLQKQTALDLAKAHHASPMIKTTLLNAEAKNGASVDDDFNREYKLNLSYLFYNIYGYN